MKTFRALALPTIMCILSISQYLVTWYSIPPIFDVKGLTYGEGVKSEAVGEFLGLCYPVEVKSINETQDGYIAISTNPKSFVVAPLDIEVDIVSKDNMRGVHFKKLGYDCYFLGFENLSIKSEQAIKSGQILGNLIGDTLFVKVYRNENRVSLKSLRRILG